MTATIVEVGSAMRIRDCPERLRDALEVRTAIAHPDAIAAERAGRRYEGDRRWLPTQREGSDLVVPRGLLRSLREQARRCGVPLRFRSLVNGEGGAPAIPIESFGIAPRPYQLEALREMHERVQGVVVLPCGGGKTVLGGLALASLGQPGVVVVHTTDLYDQWHEALSRLAPGRVRPRGERGPLGPGELAVMMVQAPDLSALATASALVVDEAHRTPADTFMRALNACPARWRWGLTATPERPDGWSYVLDVQFGPVLYRRTALQLIEDGYLRRPAILPIRIPWEPSPAGHTWMARCEACGQGSFHEWADLRAGRAKCSAKVEGPKKKRRCGTPIPGDASLTRGRMKWSVALSEWADSTDAVSAVSALSLAGSRLERRTLALVPRKATAARASRILRRNGIRADFAVSGKSGRARLIEAFREGEIEAMVATQLADEGLDVAAADLLIMASCGKAEGLTQQRAGRVCRPSGAEVPIVFDLVPDGIAHQWPARRRAYIDAYGRAALVEAEPVELGDAVAWFLSFAGGQV